MPTYEIPPSLAQMFAQRRVIPFIGSGVSAGLGLPTWPDLLERIARDIDPIINFAEVDEACNHDYLQIAEYLYLKADGRIGPLRHQVEVALQTVEEPVFSTPHVELANLDCPLVYTTNYDDLIERAFRSLNV